MNPDNREYIEDVKKKHEQIIDNVNIDRVLYAGFDTDQKTNADQVIKTFREFIEENKDEIIVLQMLDRLETVEDLDGPEAEMLTGEIENLDVEYTCLVLKRADAANTDVQVRLLLEMGQERERGGDPACSDYDEFFRRTGHPDEDPESFSNEMVIRYLDKVVVREDGYEAIFKAGVKVDVPA